MSRTNKYLLGALIASALVLGPLAPSILSQEKQEIKIETVREFEIPFYVYQIAHQATEGGLL